MEKMKKNIPSIFDILLGTVKKTDKDKGEDTPICLRWLHGLDLIEYLFQNAIEEISQENLQLAL